MRTLGLLAGMSWESSAVYYRLLNQYVQESMAQVDRLHSAPLLIHSVDFAPIATMQREGRWDDAAAVLAQAAQRLEQAGAAGILLCTNTMHKVAPAIAGAIGVPFLHIADAIGNEARRLAVQRVLLLGTAFTMSQDFLKRKLADDHRLEVMVPDAADQALVHRVIFEELCLGKVSHESRERYLHVVSKAAAQGVQGVIAGCTEISMLVQPAHLTLPLLDSTALHAKAGAEFIVGSKGQVGG